MNRKQTALLGGGLGFIVSGTVLAFLWLYGIFEWRLIKGSRIDLTRVLWPSSSMLTVTWRSTVPGIMITVFSIAINCLLYMGTALFLHGIFVLFVKSKGTDARGLDKVS
jgi:hypothetical protein